MILVIQVLLLQRCNFPMHLDLKLLVISIPITDTSDINEDFTVFSAMC